MFRHQMTGSWQDGRDCRLSCMRCTALSLLALVCGLLVCGLAGAVDYGAGSGIDDINSGNCSTCEQRNDTDG
jgi:hypothetical protein